MSMSRAALAALSLSLLGACATEGFYVKVMRPAPVNLGRYDLIAIDRFTGNGCAHLESDLTDALRSAVNPMTGQADFDVVDRREVDSMLDEMRARPGAGFDERSMGVLERWKNAQVVIKADMQDYAVDEERVEQFWVDRDGVRHTTYTLHRTAQVTALIEARESEHGPVFDSVRLEGVATAQAGEDGAEPPGFDKESLLAAARQQIVAGYLQRVFPHEDHVRVSLFTDGDLPQLQVGNGFARTGDWDAALESYHEASERATGELAEVRYKALFNIGVAYEYTNQFDAARKALKDSYALEQDDMILQELQNVGLREQEFQSLVEQSNQMARPSR